MVSATLAHLPPPSHRLLLCHLGHLLQCGDQHEETPRRPSGPRILLHHLLLVKGKSGDKCYFDISCWQIIIDYLVQNASCRRCTSCSVTSPSSRGRGWPSSTLHSSIVSSTHPTASPSPPTSWTPRTDRRRRRRTARASVQSSIQWTLSAEG